MTTERSPKMGQYTKEDFEEYRRKVDEQAAKEEEARTARMEKESARRLRRTSVMMGVDTM
jgi:hypothetical protein